MTLRLFLAKLKSFLPGARDLHLYGGALLVAAAVWFYDWRLALGVLGGYLVYLGRPWR